MSSITEYFAIGMLCGISIVIGRQCEKNNRLIKEIKDIYMKLEDENARLIQDNLEKDTAIGTLRYELGKLKGKEGSDLIQFVINDD